MKERQRERKWGEGQSQIHLIYVQNPRKKTVSQTVSETESVTDGRRE